MTLWTLPGSAIASAVVCALVMPFVKRWARHHGFVAVANERSLHTGEIPVGGGLPIAACIIVGAVGFGSTIAGWSAPWWIGYSLGALAIAVVSWYDDRHGASTGLRLAVHASAAVLIVVTAYDLSEPATLPLAVVAIVWIVGVTNAYNFMDGIDGIAGSQGAVAGAGWALLAWQSPHPLMAILGAIVCGASVGFLPHNWHRARIFMGDAGAAVLGFSFATLTAVAFPAAPALAIGGALCLWPFLFDATFTLIRRWRRGENILMAHRAHLYQRLVAAGWSHAQVARTYAALAATGVLLGGIAVGGGRTGQLVIGATLAALATGLWAITIRQERRGLLRDIGAAG